MILSDDILKNIGFEKMEDGAKIEAQFFGLYIYQLRGVNFENEFCEKFIALIDEVKISYAIGSDLDTISDCLLGDVLTNNTQEWEKEKGAKPPYVAVLVGPTKPYIGEGCRIQKQEDILVTYQCFQAAKTDLSEKSDLVVPRVISAIDCNLSVLSQNTELIFVDYSVFGKTSEGDTINDIRFEMNASITVSSAVKNDALTHAMQLSSKHGQALNPKASNFFNLASQEKDALKKFLFYFLAIEITTHLEFQKIDHDKFLKEFFSPPSRISTSAHALFQLRNEYMKNLKDRFVWCALCAWKEISDDDITALKAIKKTRDDIGHGNTSSPTTEQIKAARNLARKVLLQKVPK